MTETMTPNRFDFPRQLDSFLAEAIDTQILDGRELLALGAAHGTDWSAIVKTVLEYAWVNRHTAAGRQVHANLVKLADSASIAIRQGLA